MIRVSNAVQCHAQKMVLLISLLFGAALLMSDDGFATGIKNTEPSAPANSEPTKPTKNGEAKNVVRFAKTGAFDNDTVVRLARQLATKPYIALKDPLPESLANISYDEYRDIRFKPDSAVWKADGLPYQMQLFHRGFFFQDLIEIALVEGNKST
ncbi:MAG: glucan biosynthesis protein, partial [Vibrio sp.]